MHWVIEAEKNGKLSFTSQYARSTFIETIKKGITKFCLEVHDDEHVKKEKRGYFYGGLVYAFCDWHEALDWRNRQHRLQVESWFKTEFHGVLVDFGGKPQKVPVSTSNGICTNKEYGQFLNRIVRYFEQNQIPIPTPSLYKLWRNKYSFDNPVFYEWLEENNMKCDGSPLKINL